MEKYTFTYTLYTGCEDTPDDVMSLVKVAAASREGAYAPYSDFLVGAAIEMQDGSIHTGNNQENAAYPSGLCAERVALFHAGAMCGDKKIKRIAIVGGPRDSVESSPAAPCGACRQSMLEYEERQGEPIEVVFAGVGLSPIYSVHSVKDLLPFSFGKENLEG